MKIKWKAVVSLSLTSMFLSLPPLPAQACGPDYPSAVIINWTHPDMPLKIFGAGNIGVVQPSWAKSYLCVAYRYLSEVPLNEKEQSSIMRLWHHRLGEVDMFAEGTYTDPLDKYLKVRAKVLGLTDKDYYQVYSPAASYSVEQRIAGSAFDTARITLEDRIKKYGVKSPQVKEWINGQDHVFGIGYDKDKSIPPALDNNADALMKADRQYQIAAATFYLTKYGEAAKLFEKIGQDKNSPWASWSPYLVARCKVNAACGGDEYSSFDDAKASIKALLAKETNKDKRQDYVDFLGRLEAASTDPGELLDRIVPVIAKDHCETYGHDVGDVTVVMERINSRSNDPENKTPEYDFAKHDMLDWINTFQRPFEGMYYMSEEEKKKMLAEYNELINSTIEKWRKTHSNQWLVAAVCTGTLKDPKNKDLLDASLNLPSKNPAYLTANFYAIDALIAQKNTAEARKRIQTILSMKNLPPTSQNMFKAQLLAVATTPDEYLEAACLNFPAESSNNLFLPEDWLKVEKLSDYIPSSSGWDGAVADDLNRNLPLSRFVSMAQNKKLSSDFRKKLTACSWVRAHALNRPEIAKGLSASFASFYPNLAGEIKACDNAADATTRQYLIAKLMTKAFGVTPYLESGVPRMGALMNQFNWYHRNYWLPLPPKVEPKKEEYWSWSSVVTPGNDIIYKMLRTYYKPGISRLLPAQEKIAAAKEVQTLYNNHPSKMLGEAVIHYAQTNPKDPASPELLHLIVKLPKWSGSSDVGSVYSKKAYQVLQAKYKGSKWAKKAPCWY